MSTDAAGPAADERESGDVERAVLPDSIRRHLGRGLAEAFGQAEAPGDAVIRFADVLAKLDAAFREARGGEDAAFRSGLLTLVPALRRYAVSLTHDPTAADDLVQDALLRAWRRRAGFVSGTNLEAWTFTILRNQFYTQRRKHSREVRDEDGERAARLVAVPEQAGHLDLVDMRKAIARLPASMREALLLVAVENLSYERAAAVMGCTIGTVKSRVWRARERLAKVLGYGGAEIGQDGVTLSAMGEMT